MGFQFNLSSNRAWIWACKRKTLSAWIFALCLCSYGVSYASEPRDLSLQSVQVVNLQDQVVAHQPITVEKFPQAQGLMVTFSTAVDLYTFAHRHDYSLFVDSSVCAGNKLDSSKKISLIGYVYNRNGIIDPQNYANKGADEEGIKTYEIFLFMRTVENASNTDKFNYNLLTTPEDLCFRLGGGNMLGGTFKSNVVLIPKEAIEHAISVAR